MSSHARDLTRGPVLRQLILYAVPMVLTSFLQSVYGLVDMMVTGQYCWAEGLSNVYNGSIIMNLIPFIAVGLSTGGNVVIGQCYGAGDEEGRKKAASTTMGFIHAGPRPCLRSSFSCVRLTANGAAGRFGAG